MNYTDQIGETIFLKEKPERIISVVPSQTELLYDLGLENEVAGITKFCVHPQQWFRTKTRVGGTKNLNLELIRDLKPDIIFANKEENTKKDIVELQKHFPVWTSDIKTLDDALEMIRSIGEICGKKDIAQGIIHTITENFRSLKQSEIFNCVYLIWNDPIMTAGKNTFIDDMLGKAGFRNKLGDHERYPVLTADELKKLNPDFLFLSSEPFPFKEKHIELYRQILPESNVMIVDGEMFSWYGSRLIKAAGYFSELRQKIQNAS